jgi:tetratricopeptide (TPR) repeat protein
MTGAAGRSVLVAAMFAVHPLHVESVAWVAERKDVLSTFFLLLAVWAYVSYVRRPHWGRYAGVAALFALALASKPMVVTLPIVLLLLDAWPLRRARIARAQRAAWLRLAFEKLPLLAMAAATGIATVAVQQQVGAVAGLDVLSWQARVANAVVAYVVYAWKTLWPVDLAAFYPFRAIPPALAAGASIALAGATAAAIRCRQRYPYVLAGWLWFLVTVAPVIGLMQAGEQAWADRFMYVPIVGLLILAAWGVPDLVRRWTRRAAVVPAAAAAAVVLFALLARAQASRWSDSVTLWRHAVEVTAHNYRAHENLGQALRDRGALNESLASYRTALSLVPAGWTAYAAVIHNATGVVLTRQGRTPEAAAHFEQAVRLDSDFAEARTNLGNALASGGRLEEAVEQYRAAIRLDPGAAEPRVGLGGAFLTEGRAGDAVPQYREALRLSPDLAEAHNGLGAALALQGRLDAAMAEYDEALRLKPDLATAHYNAAVLLVRQGRIAEARARLERAVSIDPGYRPARDLLERIRAL